MTEEEMVAEIESLKGRLHAALMFGQSWMDRTAEADITIARLRRQLEKSKVALAEVWRIVHVPSKATNYRKAQDHFMADFDAIRAVVNPILTDEQGTGK